MRIFIISNSMVLASRQLVVLNKGILLQGPNNNKITTIPHNAFSCSSGLFYMFTGYFLLTTKFTFGLCSSLVIDYKTTAN